ncbi:hypothetical protein FD754_008988 [Muntiacus muntjak]|uniref:Leucine rich adaptor protein 1 like n=1 Tax=Muntiacus muntjak TaxID=9888 RepID=A0A5N3WSM9_MUNMU|nr:hypothetical protein FD754_008988 [Muntiacus muntjak]
MQETQVRSLGQEDPLEKEMATHSSILAWEITWIEDYSPWGHKRVNLRATDGKLMRQLLLINESIESIKWMIEEKATITSRGSSLSGSLCSLLESQSTSLRGSYSSLHDGSDGLDGISVGSYLDTLADDVPGHQTPSDLDQFSDSSVIGDSHALYKRPKLDSEYYCFG